MPSRKTQTTASVRAGSPADPPLQTDVVHATLGTTPLKGKSDRVEVISMARLYRVLVPVTDIEDAQQFYESVLGSTGRRVSPGRHYFDCEGTILACFDPQADGDGYVAKRNPEPLYIAVSDLNGTFEACKEAGAQFAEGSPPGVGPLGEIAKRPWGELSFYASDPFGNPLCFVSADSVFTG